MIFSQDNWTGQDKAIHLIGGFVISIILYFFFKVLGCSFAWSIGLSFVFSEVINVLKELTDCTKTNPTGFSYKDICTGNIGNVIGLLTISGANYVS
jgi:uncharacterized protein YfiM (DUF2279 family)